jgi:hypothetical protein
MIAATIIIVFVLAIIIGINSSFKEETREHFLKRMEKLTEGTYELVEGEEKMYRIPFSFERENFVFEDLEVKGLKEKINKAYLKAKVAVPLTLQFTEKKRKDNIHTPMIIASDIPNYVETNLKTITVPASLSEFDIYTNNPDLSNQLLQNKKVLQVFNRYKNTSLQGYPILSLKIVDGVIVLEFHPLVVINPNLPGLKKDIHLLENYLDQLLVVMREIKKLSS